MTSELTLKVKAKTALKPSWKQTAELIDMGLGDRFRTFEAGTEVDLLEASLINGHQYVVLADAYQGIDRGFFWDPNVDILPKLVAVSTTVSAPPAPEYPSWDLGMDFASRIIRYMMSKKYRIADGYRERNIVYLEGVGVDGIPNSDRLDEWNDISCVISFDKNKPYFAMDPVTATTEPGAHYTWNPMNSGGAFRIAFGQYAAWQVGRHGADWGLALVQSGDITGYRDKNKDGSRAGDKMDTGNNFFVNQHRPYSTGTVGRSSAGCLVRESLDDHWHFMDLVMKDPRYLRDRSFTFDTTVIDGNSFNDSAWGYGK